MTPVHVLPPRHGIYHAAFPGFCADEACASAARIRAFEQKTGRRIVWAYFSDARARGVVGAPHDPLHPAHAARGLEAGLRRPSRLSWAARPVCRSYES